MRDTTVWYIGGMITVYLSQWLRKKADQLVGRREGTYWKCREIGCGMTAQGYIGAVRTVRDTHYDQTPSHKTAKDKEEDL